MTKLRIGLHFAVVSLAVGLSTPVLAQSLNRLFEAVPGIILNEIQRRESAPVVRAPAPPPVVIDAIPAAQCRSIQSALSSLGYAVGTVDGQCGPRTRNAIAQFQQSLGANPTGRLTAAQERSLLAQSAPPAPPPVRTPPPPAAPPVATVQPQPVRVMLPELPGIWDGSYTCGQGVTRLTLTFTDAGDGQYRGRFAFGSLPGRSDVPEGEYEIVATGGADGTINISPGNWVNQPPNYATAPLSGTLSADGKAFEGDVLHASCSGFKVTRREAPAVVANAPAAPAPEPATPAPRQPDPAPPAPEPEAPRDADIDCSMAPVSARSDCDVFKRHATSVYFGPDAAAAQVGRACSALEGDWTEPSLVECLAGAFALREHKAVPMDLFGETWSGLGSVLESAQTCSAVVDGIQALAAAMTGKDVGSGKGADQARCQQLAMMAMSRQSRPAWGSCAVGTDPTLVHLECRPADSTVFLNQWKAAVEACAADKAPDALNRAIADAAKTAGRQAPTLTCTDIERIAVDDGILTEADIAAARAKVAAEAERARQAAEAAEQERKRREEAAELARKKAEEERLAEVARQERVAAERAANPLFQILQVPPAYSDTARAIELGESFNFTDGSLLFTAGIAAELLENCRTNIDAGQRVELAAFVTTASLQAMGGNQYSAPKIGDMMTDQAASTGAYMIGVTAARSAKCTGAGPMLEHIADLVRDNKTGRDGGVSPFIASCSPVHGQASCTCLAELGRASYSNIYQMQYSRDVVYGILSNNPMAGLMVAMSCGISNY